MVSSTFEGSSDPPLILNSSGQLAELIVYIIPPEQICIITKSYWKSTLFYISRWIKVLCFNQIQFFNRMCQENSMQWIKLSAHLEFKFIHLELWKWIGFNYENVSLECNNIQWTPRNMHTNSLLYFVELTHCGPVNTYGDIDQGEHCLG